MYETMLSIAPSAPDRVAVYQDHVRRTFGCGGNRQVLGPSATFVFDAEARGLPDLPTEVGEAWDDHLGELAWSTFVTSPVDPRGFGPDVWQRAGICLIESSLTRQMYERHKQGRQFTEDEAVAAMEAYPSESQLLGWKPLLPMPSVVFYEDVLCQERWDQFTGGRFSGSARLQAAFEAQVERTSQCLQRWARLVRGGRPAEVQFVRFSQIWDRLRDAARDWLLELRGEIDLPPAEADILSANHNIPAVLYTYIGPRLAEVAGLPATELVLCRQLSHLQNNAGWANSPDLFIRFFDAAVKALCRRAPRPMVGYLDLLAGASKMEHLHGSRIEAPVRQRLGDPTPFLPFVECPMPLSENPILHRGLMYDFLPGMRPCIETLFELESTYARADRTRRRSLCAGPIGTTLETMRDLYLEASEEVFRG